MTEKFKLDTTVTGDSRTPFKADEYKNIDKASSIMGDKDYEEGYLADVIRAKMKRDNKRFWAGDNVSDYVTEEMKHTLIDEASTRSFAN
jgi:hypothetical protein